MAAPAGNRWQRIEELFYAALELPLADRKLFLEKACGNDSSLREEVQSLLDSSNKTVGFLEQSVLNAARDVDEAADAIVGRQIGG